MVLSKRERRAFWMAIGVLGLFISDSFVITPVFEALDSVRKEKMRLSVEVDSMRRVLKYRGTREKKWKEMIEQGLLDDPSAAQSSMSHAIEDWSDRSRVELTAITPASPSREGGLREIIFTIAGRGDMASIGEFVWLIEQTPMPVKIMSLTLGSTNSSGRDLTLNLKISMLYRADEDAA